MNAYNNVEKEIKVPATVKNDLKSYIRMEYIRNYTEEKF